MNETDCTHNLDPLKLVREGTSQEQRPFQALDPAYAPVNERTPAHGMVFAQAYARYLRYYGSSNVALGDWQQFFASDVSVQLAVAAIQDVKAYQTQVQESMKVLNDLENDLNAPLILQKIKNTLGYLFSSIGTLAVRLDTLRTTLPSDLPLRGALQNIIASQLAVPFQRFWAYYKHDRGLATPLIADLPAQTNASSSVLVILGSPALPISAAYDHPFSTDWLPAGSTDWLTYRNTITPIDGYGSGSTVFSQANHLATHNLFTAIFDQFLKAYARLVGDAKLALDATFTKYDRHEPHYTLFLAFLRLQEYARQETNTLTGRHLDFYYRDILRLREKPAEPGHAHLLLELAKHVESHLIQAGESFKAGKDDLGRDAFFTADRDFVANAAKVTALKSVYRHKYKPGDTLPYQDDRLFASPIANSDDGLGAELLSADQSWHPFANKIYVDGALAEIRMPPAEVGFAVASHYLFLAEGVRTITLNMITNSSTVPPVSDLICLFTSAEGWVEKTASPTSTGPKLVIILDGADPAITPYNAKIHGYGFDTNLPMLLVKIKHNASLYLYQSFQDTQLTGIELNVKVTGLKTLAISNDFGSVDASKPFQPFGASPVKNQSLTIGSKEIFQKKLDSASIEVKWQVLAVVFGTSLPSVNVDFLQGGKWEPSGISLAIPTAATPVTQFVLSANLDKPVVDRPDFTKNETYKTELRHGFVRLKLDNDFGQDAYQRQLISHLRKDVVGTGPVPHPGPIPVGPSISEISLDYAATQTIALNSTISAGFEQRQARFFHVAPFGHAEQHPVLAPIANYNVYLFPQFQFQRSTNQESVGEFYIGLTGLQPRQNLALLFQVADGTADPLAIKPRPHLHWSHLRANEWVDFAKNEVDDQTGEFTRSGIVTLSMPRDITANNTLLPAGMHWIRVAVSEKSEAVCRLVSVAAQALRATFVDRSNDPAFPAKVLPAATISKLERPTAEVKKVVQPFATFGGRGQEASANFYTRVSERLRHKDRAITLWDYERLVLEAFPQIYKAKCLNHTEYEPNESGMGTYRELAPGHVTVVTIPNQQQHNLRNPLRPYTSLGTLLEIEALLKAKTSCFVRLHVKNPQFEEVKTEFRVHFHAGYDETFYLKKLREEITRFLSPWAFPGGGSPSFGGKIYQSVLINFVEERPWVDYVADFRLRHKRAGSTVFSKNDSEVEASTAVSILVSVPVVQHLITIIPADAPTESIEKCPCES